MLPRLVAVALGLFVGALPMIPAEHVHESDVDGHHEVLVHRHAEAHVQGLDDRHYDEFGRAIDHDDGHTITLGSFFTVPSAFAAERPVRPLVALLDPPPVVLLEGHPTFVEYLNHGPPRSATSLRAPPVLPRL